MTREFTVFGKIRGKASVVTFMFKGRPVTTKNPKTRSYEALIQENYLAEYKGCEPLTGALELWLEITFGVPASYSKKKKAACLANQILPTKKPDNSNVLKSIEDALSKGVAFADDKQIVDNHISKRYGEVEKMVVTLKELEAGGLV